MGIVDELPCKVIPSNFARQILDYVAVLDLGLQQCIKSHWINSGAPSTIPQHISVVRNLKEQPATVALVLEWEPPPWVDHIYAIFSWDFRGDCGWGASFRYFLVLSSTFYFSYGVMVNELMCEGVRQHWERLTVVIITNLSEIPNLIKKGQLIFELKNNYYNKSDDVVELEIFRSAGVWDVTRGIWSGCWVWNRQRLSCSVLAGALMTTNGHPIVWYDKVELTAD